MNSILNNITTPEVEPRTKRGTSICLSAQRELRSLRSFVWLYEGYRALGQLFKILFIVSLSFSFVSCDPEAKYYTEGVKIEIEVPKYSAGYAVAEYKTNKECYYLTGIENIGNKDIENYPSQYMALAVDSVYVHYVEWRHSYLKKGESNIADFQSHELKYGNSVDLHFPLEPNKEYWLYAFVVDPSTKQPCGDLFKRRIRTRTVAEADVHCDARIDSTWVYAYPKNKQGSINDYCPYFWDFVDDDEFQTKYHGSVDEYLVNMLPNEDEYYFKSSFGVDVFNDANYYYLQVGKTYHWISCTLDGKIANKVHYKFEYTSRNMKAEFKYPKDNIPE